MKLFKFENYQVVIEPEVLLLKPFSVIWKRDRSRNKNIAIQELGYIYFFCDSRSDYMFIINEEERTKAIIEGEGLPNNWKPDKQVKEAIEFYNSFKSASALLLEDTRIAVDKLRSYIRDLDLSLVDDKGKPIYTLNSITATIKIIPSLIKDLDEAEKALAKEDISKGKMRGSGEKTIFEDGIEL